MSYKSPWLHLGASLFLLVIMLREMSLGGLPSKIMLGLSIAYAVGALNALFTRTIFGLPAMARQAHQAAHERRGGFDLHLRGIHIHVAECEARDWLRLREVEQAIDAPPSSPATWRGRLKDRMRMLPASDQSEPQAYAEAQALVDYLRSSRLGDEHFRLRLIQHIERNVLHTLAQASPPAQQSR